MTNWKETVPANERERVYLILIFAVLALLAAMLFIYPRTRAAAETSASAAETADEPAPTARERLKIVEVEKTVTVETLEDGLRGMGTLVTQEYYFTDLVSFSSVKKFLSTDFVLPFTESSYMVRYDGVVSAGTDLSRASVEKDDTEKIITVRLPAAAISATVIDLDSFELLEEKTGIGNHISARDFNNSLRELESRAERNATERGLLEKADENAREVIARFIAGMVDGYELRFATI